MVTRKVNPKATLTAAPANPQPLAADIEDNQRSYLHSLLDEALAEGFGWKRMLVGSILGLAAAAGLGWMLGNLIAYMLIGCIMLTGSALLANALAVLAMIVSFFLGGKVASATYMAVCDGTVERGYSSLASRVRGWFNKTPTPEAA